MLTQHFIHSPGSNVETIREGTKDKLTTTTHSLLEGLVYFKKLVELQPSPELLCNYATACRWVKNNQEAERALLRALELDPENIAVQWKCLVT